MNTHQADINAEFDSEFWCCLVFQSRAQKQAFLSSLGLIADGKGDKYIDGQELAKIVGVDLPKGPGWKPIRPPAKKWADLASPSGG